MVECIHTGLPGQCMKCGRGIFNGCASKCPHKPVTAGAYWFREMYCRGGKEKFINNTIKNDNGMERVVPFPKWCEDNKEKLEALKVDKK